MTELPYRPIPYVAGFLGDEAQSRDDAAHELILSLSALLGPSPTDRVVVESYHEPSNNGWRLVAHRVPARPGTPETPEETTARVTLALEAALSSEEGRAIAAAIIDRKKLAEYRKEAGLAESSVKLREALDVEDGLDRQIHADLAEGRQ